MRLAMTISLLGAMMLVSGAVVAQPTRTFESVTVELPDSDAQFVGPGADAANNNCLACHSVEMVTNQPALPREAWTKIVDKMRHVYKAPVTDDDAAAIVSYLAALKGSQ